MNVIIAFVSFAIGWIGCLIWADIRPMSEEAADIIRRANEREALIDKLYKQLKDEKS
jgi:hypothetical protein